MTDLRTLMAGHRFFEGLDDVRLDTIASCGEVVELRAGAQLAREGEPADRFYAIRSGHVAVGSHLPHRGSVTVATVGPGEVLGWSWLLAPHRWHFDAVTIEPVSALAFDAARLRTAIAADDGLNLELTRRVAGVMSRRLAAARLQLLDLYATSHPETRRGS